MSETTILIFFVVHVLVSFILTGIFIELTDLRDTPAAQAVAVFAIVLWSIAIPLVLLVAIAFGVIFTTSKLTRKIKTILQKIMTTHKK